MGKDELWRWDAVDLAAAVRARRISSREAVAAHLGRIDAVNPRINAVVDRLDDEALKLADAADAAVRRGDALGPLHGVPVTVKINVDVAGRPTTNGVVAFKDAIAPGDSPVVANLRQAGAIIVGRTNTPSFSFRWFTENDLHGETINPWGRHATPGGSSGGASAAVASGISAISHGNDYGGSIRYPAYCAGIFGIRPSFGRVPAYRPALSEERPICAQLMAVQGPHARGVADLRTALWAMSAGDPHDPWWVPAPQCGPAPARPIKVARLAAPGASPEVVAALDTAARWLSEAGYVVDAPGEAPSIDDAAALWTMLVGNEGRLFTQGDIEKYGDAKVANVVRAMASLIPEVDARAYLKGLARRTGVLRTWQLFLERWPLILCPVSDVPPLPPGADQGGIPAMEMLLRAQRWQYGFNGIGLPGISCPTGVNGSTPMGVQLVAGRFREDLLLDAAAIMEARCGRLTPIDPR
ncbi:MAG: amidase family protein [Alphaproteobacteria bacterium]|nr:amidase family protein [Alphaproteobacteria bacterium]